MLTRDQAMTLVEKSRLPEGKTCGDCIHFHVNCEWLFVSDKGPKRHTDDICYFLPSRFNVPVEVVSLAAYRKPR